jgi:hypothetical protein
MNERFDSTPIPTQSKQTSQNMDIVDEHRRLAMERTLDIAHMMVNIIIPTVFPKVLVSDTIQLLSNIADAFPILTKLICKRRLRGGTNGRVNFKVARFASDRIVRCLTEHIKTGLVARESMQNAISSGDLLDYITKQTETKKTRVAFGDGGVYTDVELGIVEWNEYQKSSRLFLVAYSTDVRVDGFLELLEKANDCIGITNAIPILVEADACANRCDMLVAISTDLSMDFYNSNTIKNEKLVSMVAAMAKRRTLYTSCNLDEKTLREMEGRSPSALIEMEVRRSGTLVLNIERVISGILRFPNTSEADKTICVTKMLDSVVDDGNPRYSTHEATTQKVLEASTDGPIVRSCIHCRYKCDEYLVLENALVREMYNIAKILFQLVEVTWKGDGFQDFVVCLLVHRDRDFSANMSRIVDKEILPTSLRENAVFFSKLVRELFGVNDKSRFFGGARVLLKAYEMKMEILPAVRRESLRSVPLEWIANFRDFETWMWIVVALRNGKDAEDRAKHNLDASESRLVREPAWVSSCTRDRSLSLNIMKILFEANSRACHLHESGVFIDIPIQAIRHVWNKTRSVACPINPSIAITVGVSYNKEVEKLFPERSITTTLSAIPLGFDLQTAIAHHVLEKLVDAVLKYIVSEMERRGKAYALVKHTYVVIVDKYESVCGGYEKGWKIQFNYLLCLHHVEFV